MFSFYTTKILHCSSSSFKSKQSEFGVFLYNYFTILYILLKSLSYYVYRKMVIYKDDTHSQWTEISLVCIVFVNFLFFMNNCIQQYSQF